MQTIWQMARPLRHARGLGLVVLWFAFLTQQLSAAEPVAVAWTADGQSQSGPLRPETLQTPDLWQLTVPSNGARPTRPRFWLHLPGGGRLGIQGLVWDNETLHFLLTASHSADSGEELELDAGSIAGVQPVRRDASWRTDETDWSRVANCRETEDLVLLKNGDRQLGEIQKVSDESIQLKNDLGNRDLAWTSIAGLRMNPELTEAPAVGQERWVVHLADESWCLVKHLALDANGWQLTLTNSLKFKVPTHSVSWLAPIDERRVPLSRVEIAEQAHRPLFVEEGLTAVIDRNLRGLPLRRSPGNAAVPSLSPLGYGLTSGMQLRWKLDGQFDRLVCDVGLDAMADDVGHAIVRFRSGDQLLKEITARGGQPPERVTVLLQDAAVLEIEVDYGEHCDLGDLVDLFHPVLYKSMR